MQDVVEKTLTTWPVPIIPTVNHQPELIELLQSLQNQIATLAQRVADLEATLAEKNKS